MKIWTNITSFSYIISLFDTIGHNDVPSIERKIRSGCWWWMFLMSDTCCC